MADKITAQDVLSPEVIKEFQKLNKELENTLSIMSTLSKEFIKSDTALKGAVKSTNDLQKAEEKSNKEKTKLSENEKELIRIEQQQQKILQSAAGSYNQLNAQLVKARIEYKRMSDEQAKGAGGKALLKNIQNLDKKLKDFDKTMGQSQRNVGNYGSAFEGIKGKVIGFLGIFGGATAIFGVFKKAVDSTGESEDKFGRLSMQAEFATKLFLKSLVTGDLSNFKERLNEVIQAAGQYFDIMDKLEDQNRSLGVQEAKKNIEIQKNLIISKDQTKSDQERLDALTKVDAMERALAEERTKLTKTAYDAQLNIMSTLTGLHSSRIKQYVEEYNSVESLMDVGEKYNAQQKELEQLQKGHQEGFGMYQKTVYDYKAIDKAKKSLDEMGYSAKVAGVIAAKYNESTAKEYDDLASKAKAYYGAISSADENLQRVTMRRTGLIEEIKKKNEKEKEDYLKGIQEKKMEEIEFQQEIEDVNNKAYEKRREIIDEEIKENNEALEIMLKDQEEASKREEDFKKQAHDRFLQWIEEEKRAEQDKIQLQKELIQDSADLYGTIIDSQIEKNEYAKQKELESAGDNEKKKEQIEKRYAAKNGELRRRQALTDKAAALFQVAINTAMGVTNANSKVATIPLVPWIIAQGIIQAGIIAAKPIPKFYKGVKDFEGGIAEVGELGTEMIKTPAGDIFLTPNEATKMILPKGTDVFTHTETKEMLGNGISVGKWDEMIKEQKETRKALSKQTKNNFSITPEGWKYTQEKNNQRVRYIDKYFRI